MKPSAWAEYIHSESYDYAFTKKNTLKTKYLLPMGYSFVIPEADAIVNEPPLNCIAIHRVAFYYDVRFPLHPVIVDILRKFELTLA